jgi:hypothetical protein
MRRPCARGSLSRPLPDDFRIVVDPQASPNSNPIEVDALPKKRDDEKLLHAMGTETANVHLGIRPRVKSILKDLHRRRANWLRSAAKEMAKQTFADREEYKKG